MTTKHGTSKQNPLRIAYYFIKHPCRVILLVTTVLLITILLDYFGFEFNSTSTHSYYVLDDLNVHRADSLNLAIRYLKDVSTAAPPKSIEVSSYTLLMMYKTKDHTNLLQASSIADYISYINLTNNRIPNTNYNDYYSLCLADTADSYTTYPDCSSSSIWDPIVSTFSSYNPHDITQNDIDIFIQSNLANPYTKSAFLSCFEEGFETSSSSSYYRAFYRFGLPYPDINSITSSYKDATDDRDEQNDYYSDYIFPLYQSIQIDGNNHDNIEIVILGSYIRGLQRSELTYAGVAFAAGSIITVFLIMCWHLNSVFLSAAAMLQIILGFPFAYALYRYIFMVTFFDTLNTLVIFLILGIGADDVFVLVDAWVQSAHFVANPDDLIERMSFAYRRAAKAMIVTTATTFFAFIATAFSPIMPIAGFGIWAGCVVSVNYLMVVTLFPAFLSYWYQHVREREKIPSFCIKIRNMICICWKKQKSNNKPNQKQRTNNIQIDKSSNDEETEKEKEELDGRWLEKFLGTKFADLIIKIRWFIIAFVVILVGLSVSQAMQISPLTKQEQWFDKSHYMEKMYDWQQYFTGGSVTTLIKLKMVWGIQQRCDRTGVSFWEGGGDDYGKVQFDDTFNPTTYDAQLYLLNVCNMLLSNYSDMLYDVNDYFDCWVYDFIDYGDSLGLQYPFIFDGNNDNIQTQMYYELIRNWTTLTPQGNKYATSGKVAYVDDKLKFVFIEFQIPHSRWTTLNDKEDIYNEWEDIMNEFNSLAPNDGVNKGYQISSHAWGWMASEKGFVTSALQGIAIAMPLALLCLILSTQNWIVSLYATSAIICIVVCEVALMVLQGWELGISECIAIVMMIGFSVDYVVHIGNSYQECETSDKRIDKLKFSLFTMGISVVSGALTTFASGFWLIFPEMFFFKKFGILVMTVVVFSLFYSMVYFIALLALWGPQGDAGNINLNKYIAKICKPLSSVRCKCCDYICCCIGTIPDYYKDKKSNKNTKTEIHNRQNKMDLVMSDTDVQETELVISSDQIVPPFDDVSSDEEEP